MLMADDDWAAQATALLTQEQERTVIFLINDAHQYDAVSDSVDGR